MNAPTVVSRSGMRHLIDGNVKPKQGRITMLCGFTIRPVEDPEPEEHTRDCPWCFPRKTGEPDQEREPG